MPLLTKAEILAANDLPVKEVEVPEWGGVVRLRALSVAQREALEDFMFNQGKRDQWRAYLVAATAVDENGELLFGPDDVESLRGKSFDAVERVFMAAKRLSGIGKEGREEAKKN